MRLHAQHEDARVAEDPGYLVVGLPMKEKRRTGSPVSEDFLRRAKLLDRPAADMTAIWSALTKASP